MVFNKKFLVYILCSMVDGTYYIGSTSDLEMRIKQHNDGKSRYTSAHRPYELVYSETFFKRLEAEFREKAIKRYAMEFVCSFLRPVNILCWNFQSFFASSTLRI